MKLLILCVDGHLAPDHPSLPYFLPMKYERKLTIPEELYLYGQPHTLVIWASIFAGHPVIHDWEELLKRPEGLKLRQWFRRKGFTRFFKKVGVDHKPFAEKLHKELRPDEWGRNVAFNYDLETVLKKYKSIMWNVPTLDPTYRYGINKDRALKHKFDEFDIFRSLAYGMSFVNYDIGVVWTGIIDRLGHLMGKKDEMSTENDVKTRAEYEFMWQEKYLDIHHLTEVMPENCVVMVLSDHGTFEGDHTDHAYIGCTEPVYAESVLDVRNDIERIVGEQTHQTEFVEPVYSDEEEKIIKKRLRRLGYIE